MGFKSKTTKEIEKSLKTNKKKENQMKRTVITTVALTLVTISAFVMTFFAGMQYEQKINDRVKAEAKNLTSLVTPSKQ